MTAPTEPLATALAQRYRIERELGHGGMATVYLAHDIRHQRRVAIKVLRPELAVMLGRERFQREIRLTAQLQHPGILSIFDSGKSAGHLWYAMSYAEGESLRARLNREGQLPVGAALQTTREVAAALTYAHAHGVVHRDIKPENILFSGGRALVADFGIARAFDTIDTERLTETGLSLGTPHYMSPEQSMGEKGLDGRSDLYALACVLYEMLAGETPYTGPNAQAIIAKRLTQPVPSVRTLRETVSERVDRALSIALAKSPADRFGSTSEFIGAMDLATVESQPPTQVLRPRRPRAQLAQFALVTAVAGSVAGWVVLRSRAVIPSSATVMAVLPFAPTSSDTALVRLGRDLATTIGASLDGVGDIRTVDRLTILAQVPERDAALPLKDAAALGRRLGASSVVHGSLAREGARVRLDVGLFTSDSLTPLARATVLAPPESLSALSDSVVWSLLADIWRRGRPPTPTLEAVTTRSVAALRAYLDGERLMVAGQGDEARVAYGRAIAADSSFWFAYYRYSRPMGWEEGDEDPAIRQAYWTHRQLLPQRERMLIEASQLDSGFTWQRRRLEELVHRYPDYSPGWWMLGDQLLHMYPLIGATPEDARNAMERVVTLTPTMVAGWEHLAWAARGIPDTATVARAVDALERLGAGPTFVKNEGLDKLLVYRTWLALERRDGSASRMLDSFYLDVVTPGRDHFVPSLAFSSDPAVQIAFNHRLLRHGLPPQEARVTSWFTALDWAMRGAWDSALVARAQLVRGPADTISLLNSYRTAVLGAWVGALPPGEAARRRPAAAALAMGRGPGYRAEMAWLDGVLAVAAGDLKGLVAARAALKTSGGEWTTILDRSLGAFESDLRGDRRAAASAMAALEWELAERNPYFAGEEGTPHILLRGVDRMAAAEWLQEQGDGAQALRLLGWHRTFPFWDDKLPLAPLACLFAAKIEDGAGDTTAARLDYEQFLQYYDMPLPPHRHLVMEAQDALARLAGASAPPAER